VEAHRVAAWRDEFLAAGTDGLKGRTATGDGGTGAEARRRLKDAERKVGKLTLERAAADRFMNTYQREYPAAVTCFTDDLEALLASHRVPVRHRIRVRTTNLVERSFVEERRRTKVTGRLPDEKAAMKLVFATIIRAELGLDPPTRHRRPEADHPHDPTQERRRMTTQATRLQEPQDLTPWAYRGVEGAGGALGAARLATWPRHSLSTPARFVDQCLARESLAAAGGWLGQALLQGASSGWRDVRAPSRCRSPPHPRVQGRSRLIRRAGLPIPPLRGCLDRGRGLEGVVASLQPRSPGKTPGSCASGAF
jgi:hypothetical protein